MVKSSIPWSVRQIVRMKDDGALRFDNAIQRGDVWDVKRQSLYIDSNIRGYYIPAICCIKTNDTIKTHKGDSAVFDCIDGKQRSTALSRFIKGEFALQGLEPITYNDEELELNGLTFADLPEPIQTDLLNNTVTVYFFTDITDEEVCEMMDRLNNGKPLTGVEKARIKAKDLKTIMKLASHELFGRYLTEKALLGYANEDIVIKSLIQMQEPENPSFENKKVQSVYVGHEFTDEEKESLIKLFDKTLNVLSILENDAPKKVFKKTIRKTNLLSIMYYLGKHIDEDDSCNARQIETFFTAEGKILSLDEDYNEASVNATNRAGNVLIRNNAIEAFCSAN